MTDTSWIEERERRHLAATSGPWEWENDGGRRQLVQTELRPALRAFVKQPHPLDWSTMPPDGVVASGQGGAGSQYEDIEIAPEDQAFIANARNEENRVLAILKAAAALVEHDEPTCERRLVECIYCEADRDITPEPHKPDCLWQQLVAAFEGGG